jgi:hypothetical protein
MASFLFVYRNRAESYGNMSSDELQQMLQKWQTWIADALSKAGWSSPAASRSRRKAACSRAAAGTRGRGAELAVNGVHRLLSANGEVR